MRLDAFLFHQPRQVRRGAIGCVRYKPMRPDAEALLCPVNHSSLCCHFGLPNRRCRLDIDDHRMIEVDQIIGAVGVKGPLTRGRRPARSWIGERDPLRLHRRRTAERRIVQHLQIFANGAARHIGRQAFVPGHRSTTIYIGPDQARIDGKAFAADQPFRHAARHRHLEQLAKQIAVTEAAMPVLREGRVIGNSSL